MIVLGLDPGTRRYGWGIVTADGGELSSRSGVVEQPTALPKHKRLYGMWLALERIVQYGPVDAVVIERGFAGPRSSNVAVMAIGEARGLGYLLAGALSATVVEIAPATMKKTVTGSGSATKDLVIDAVNQTLGLVAPYTIHDENEADAVGLAIALLRDRAVPGAD